MTNVSVHLQPFNNTVNLTESVDNETIFTNGTWNNGVGRAGVYHTSDFIAMGVVFSVVLILSVLWQKRWPPFCLFAKPPPKDDSFENEIVPANSGKSLMICLK